MTTAAAARKKVAPKPHVVELGKPEDREPEGSSLKRIAGSKSRAFNNMLANAVVATLWLPPNLPEESKSDRLTAAIMAMVAFKPEDEIEGMIAAQAVAMHHGSMECFRRAMIPEQPADVAARLRKDGASLARGMTEMIEALNRKRGKAGNQVVRVEHVTVQAGGQAIVGNVAPAAPGGGAEHGPGQEPGTSPARLAHDAAQGPGYAALWGADPERVPVPVPGDAER